MSRLHHRIRKLETHNNNDTNCWRCHGTGRPWIVDCPPPSETWEEFLENRQWARDFRAAHKRAEEWAQEVADGHPEVAQALAEILGGRGSLEDEEGESARG